LIHAGKYGTEAK